MTTMPIRALNLYYARDPDARAQVLATRLRASNVRDAIGVPHGRVFRRVDGNGDAPDVMWDCPFADVAGHERDMAARAASAEFESVRAQMRTLTRRFERVLYCFEHTTAHTADELTPGTTLAQAWLQLDTDTSTIPITFSADISVLRRLDDNIRLPQWIIEAPATQSSALTAQVSQRAATCPQLRTMPLVWERVA